MALPVNYQEGIESMSDAEIRTRISELACASIEHTLAMKNNEELNAAKNQVKLLKDPFTSVIKELKEQLACCAKVLDDRGKGAEI